MNSLNARTMPQAATGNYNNAAANANLDARPMKVLENQFKLIEQIGEIATDVCIRQVNFCERVFGHQPISPGGVEVAKPEPAGAADQIDQRLLFLRGLMQSISERMGDIERIA